MIQVESIAVEHQNVIKNLVIFIQYAVISGINPTDLLPKDELNLLTEKIPALNSII